MEIKEFYKSYGKTDNGRLASAVNEFDLKNAIYMAIYTDRVECDNYSGIKDAEHLLEIRIFNADSEFKAVRTDMTEDFTYRFIDDRELIAKGADLDYFDAFDETQYLDIDSKKSKGKIYFTTGGGRYNLPVEKAEKIRIRNYISYNADGEAQIKDFRIVEILKESEE